MTWLVFVVSSCNIIVISCNIIVFSCNVVFISCNIIFISCDIIILSCDIIGLSCSSDVTRPHIKMFRVTNYYVFPTVHNVCSLSQCLVALITITFLYVEFHGLVVINILSVPYS